MHFPHPIRHKFLYLFVALILYFISNALLQEVRIHYLVSLFFTILIISSLLTVANHKKILLIPLILLGISVFITMLSGGIDYVSETARMVQLPLSILFLFSITVTSGIATFQFEKVTANKLYGAVCTYLLIGLTFTYIGLTIHHFNPAAFKIAENLTDLRAIQEFIYFSFVTLTTLGYGDITPLNVIAKTVCWMEAVIGQLYLTILIAQLVGQFIAGKGGNIVEKNH